jgi:hypothetical protein
MEEKAKSKYWWVEDLVDSEVKAMGTYLALCYLLFGKRYTDFEVKPSGVSIINEDHAKRLFATYFAGRGVDARQALEAGGTFIDRLFDHEKALKSDERNSIFCEIEAKFYESFVRAFKKYLRLNQIPNELRGRIKDVLSDVRAQFYGETVTPCGTSRVLQLVVVDDIKKWRGLGDQEARRIVSYLKSSGLVMEMVSDYVFPSPCLSDEIIESLVKPLERPRPLERIEAKPPIPPPPKPERFDVKPSREILEGIVASVLKDLGFDVSTNVRKMSRGGGFIEVDVWAQKMVAGTRFSIYVSCRNWDKALDRPFIDEEAGRTLNLVEWPQLKVIVAKELTEPARETAKADGFITIELGRKAEAENAREIYELVYRALNELFTSIAPPRLREIASRIAEVRESLKKVEEELASLLAK